MEGQADLRLLIKNEINLSGFAVTCSFLREELQVPLCIPVSKWLGLLWRLSGKEFSCNAGDMGSIPRSGSGRSPGGGSGNPLQCSCLKKSRRQGSLVGYSPWGLKELDTAKHLSIPGGYDGNLCGHLLVSPPAPIPPLLAAVPLSFFAGIYFASFFVNIKSSHCHSQHGVSMESKPDQSETQIWSLSRDKRLKQLLLKQ